jgi:hypothetical protein
MLRAKYLSNNLGFPFYCNTGDPYARNYGAWEKSKVARGGGILAWRIFPIGYGSDFIPSPMC